jgi:hypothetical protein
MLKRALQILLIAGACAGFGCGDKMDPGFAAPADAGGTDTGGTGGGTGGAGTGGTGTTLSKCITSPKYADVQPILAAHCTQCHAANATDRMNAPAAVNFDTYAASQSSAADALGVHRWWDDAPGGDPGAGHVDQRDLHVPQLGDQRRAAVTCTRQRPSAARPG